MGWWILVVMVVVIDFGCGYEFCEFGHGFSGGDWFWLWWWWWWL